MGLAMLGDKLSADDAAAWGLIWRAVDDAEFVSTVDKLCAQLASAPTRALVAARQAIDAAAHNSLEAQLDRERDVQRELGYAEDYREGVAAFTAKRAPRFTGR
jgi:2-(1,2-epoxy-1,2-dihydrophenyl)acetyl-CoA isomerase